MRQLVITKQLTNRESASMDKYLQEIGKVDMISVEEEVILAQQIRLGDQEALQKLTRANLRFVVSVSKQYQNRGLSLSDLINEGNLGLMKAAKRFDETRGFKFISYAVWWIRQAILQALAEQSRIVRLPLNKIGSISKIHHANGRFEQEFERDPEVSEMAGILDISENEVRECMKNSGRHLSIDAPLIQNETITMGDTIQGDENTRPDRGLLVESLRIEIERAVSSLSIREAEIIRSYYGLNGTLVQTSEEIAERFDLTRERVRQIREKAIRKLKHLSRSTVLQTYLG